jgi:hypothetical protein
MQRAGVKSKLKILMAAIHFFYGDAMMAAALAHWRRCRSASCNPLKRSEAGAKSFAPRVASFLTMLASAHGRLAGAR